MPQALTFICSHLHSLWQALDQHVFLSLLSSLLALFIGLPLGIALFYNPRLKPIGLGIVNIFQTIPSLALLAFLIPFVGIGVKPTLITLCIYALLPIVRGTLIGLESVPKASKQAALAIGFNAQKRLFKIELPLARPQIMNGLRVAVAMNIGITTIAAFIGAGGLGQFITEGLATNSNPLILLGAIPTALLALIADFILSRVDALANARTRRDMRFKKSSITLVSLFIIYLVYLLAHASLTLVDNNEKPIIIGSKNFTEQIILANIISDYIQAKSNIPVELKANLGTTPIAQSALVHGSIDLYPEYTGTAYMVVLHQSKKLGANALFHFVKNHYQKQFQLTWLKPLGFSNSQTLAITAHNAKRWHIQNLSQLSTIASELTIAAPAEFLKRPDGFKGLSKTYHLHFKKIIEMQPSLMYHAIKNNQADIIESFTTDGWLKALKLVALKDDKHFYPPYYAAIVIRDDTLKAHPKLQSLLNQLAGTISENQMAKMNYLVDVEHENPSAVAAHFVKHLQHKN